VMFNRMTEKLRKRFPSKFETKSENEKVKTKRKTKIDPVREDGQPFLQDFSNNGFTVFFSYFSKDAVTAKFKSH